MGLEYSRLGKGVYVEGHERDDVTLSPRLYSSMARFPGNILHI